MFSLTHTLLPRDPINEVITGCILFIYVIAVVYGTRLLYDRMRRRSTPHNVAVYYCRKVIHMCAGGVVAILVPHLFSSPLIPLVSALVLAILNYIPHRTGKLMYWFQVPDNMYEVNFCIAWGLFLFILWYVLGSPYPAILPLLFISFGDAVTGIVRNAVFRRRTKHWIGNIAMATVSIPLGFLYAGSVGVLAAVVATLAERFELGPIDDNMLIPITSTIVLLIPKILSLGISP
ncbi:MAG: dolichol kinase [Thermoprotei archaeon]|nr:MAG: dolichol kinase [Thermoprotei archaeon]